jgi:hypothetical protein
MWEASVLRPASYSSGTAGPLAVLEAALSKSSSGLLSASLSLADVSDMRRVRSLADSQNIPHCPQQQLDGQLAWRPTAVGSARSAIWAGAGGGGSLLRHSSLHSSQCNWLRVAC